MNNQITSQDKLSFSTLVFKNYFLRVGFLVVALLLGLTPILSQNPIVTENNVTIQVV